MSNSASSTCWSAAPVRPGSGSAPNWGSPNAPLDILLLGVTSLRLVERTEEGYVNAKSISDLFTGGHWELVKAVVGFEAYVTYPGLVDFTESLRANSNIGLRRCPGDGATVYHRLSEDPELLKVFYHFMGTWSAVASKHLIKYGDFQLLPAHPWTSAAATRRWPWRWPMPTRTSRSPSWRSRRWSSWPASEWRRRGSTTA